MVTIDRNCQPALCIIYASYPGDFEDLSHKLSNSAQAEVLSSGDDRQSLIVIAVNSRANCRWDALGLQRHPRSRYWRQVASVTLLLSEWLRQPALSEWQLLHITLRGDFNSQNNSGSLTGSSPELR